MGAGLGLGIVCWFLDAVTVQMHFLFAIVCFSYPFYPLRSLAGFGR